MASNIERWGKLADRATVEETMSALRENGIEPYFVETHDDARRKAFELLPEGAEVMNMRSMTLEAAGIAQETILTDNN